MFYRFLHFMDYNPGYSLVMALLSAIWTVDGVLQYFYAHHILNPISNKAIFCLFGLELTIKFFLSITSLIIRSKKSVSLLRSTSIDSIALLPDLVELFLNISTNDLRMVRILRALKLLRLFRIFTKVKRLTKAILNLFKYRLRDHSLVIGANLFLMAIIVFLLAIIHYEFSKYTDGSGEFIESLQWGFKSFTSPFGESLSSSPSYILRTLSFMASAIGLMAYASMIGAFSNKYAQIFERLNKGKLMQRSTVNENTIVILGWNYMVPNVVDQILKNLKSNVLVVSTLEKDVIKERFDSTKKAKLYTDSRFEYSCLDYLKADTLKTLNIEEAQKIIIVYDETIATSSESPTNGYLRDAKVLFVLRSIKSILKTVKQKRMPKLVCEIFNKENRSLFDEENDIDIICKESLISNLYGQCLMQDELHAVYNELLKASGKELYLLDLPPLLEESKAEAKLFSEIYFKNIVPYAEHGIGVSGIFVKNTTKSEKPHVIFSPTKKELENSIHRIKEDSSAYRIHLIVFAEDYSKIESFKLKNHSFKHI